MRIVSQQQRPGRAAGAPRLTASGREAVVVVVAVLVAFLAGRSFGGDERRSAGRPWQGPGPSRSVAGVPAGYARSAAGAVAALLNHSVALSALAVEAEPRRVRVLEVVGSERFGREMAERLRVAARRGAVTPVGRDLAAGARTVYRGAPVGYRVLRWHRQEAVIESWSFAVVANDRGVRPHAVFQTAITNLVWERGDWRLDRVTVRPGPSPATEGPDTSGERMVALLSGLRAPRYAP